ncbi:hypothetical protein H2203_005083 [Taxawa tesnikishii (nom. ined.)]|nr:hypothetical protein H2203_005083 [Dothideales sp. JES 119]
MIPQPAHRPTEQGRGLFAAPWASEPIIPPIETRPQQAYSSNFAPALGPQNAHREEAPFARASGPDQSDFMNAIREQAIFAWALAGINGTLEKYAFGRPLGRSDEQALVDGDAAAVRFHRNDSGNDGQFKATKFAPGTALGGAGTRDIFGDPGYDRRDGYRSASSNNSG